MGWPNECRVFYVKKKKGSTVRFWGIPCLDKPRQTKMKPLKNGQLPVLLDSDQRYPRISLAQGAKEDQDREIAHRPAIENGILHTKAMSSYFVL